MVKKSSIYTFIAFIAFMMTVSLSSYAAEKDRKPVDLLPNHAFRVSFIHNSSESESAFTMRLSQCGVVAGCGQSEDDTSPKDQKRFHFKDGVATKFMSGRLEVIMSMPKTFNDDEDPRYSNYDCEVKNSENYVDIKLDRDELIKKKIKKIAFKTTLIDLGNYEIDTNKDRLIFKAKRFDGSEGKWIKLWFFPKNTISLTVPGSKTGQNLKIDIRDYGLAHGLVPMDEELDGYISPSNVINSMYFNDPKRIYTRQISAQNNNIKIGDMTNQRTFYGPNGPVQQPYVMGVYAALPLTRIIQDK